MALVVTARIARQILVVRGHKVMINAYPAALYGVPTKRLNEQLKRNAASGLCKPTETWASC